MRLNANISVLTLGVSGLAVGWLCHEGLSASVAHQVADTLSLGTQAFLRLIQMVIAPLVISTLTASIARVGNPADVGRMGGRAFAWFLGASILSLMIGAGLALWLRPGAGLHLIASGTAQAVQPLTASIFVQHLIPTSVADAMARNEMLQIVLFSLFAGVAMAGLGARVALLVEVLDQIAAVMFKVVDAVMRLAPLAVFCALASLVCIQGMGLMRGYAVFLGGFYLALTLLWGVVLTAAWIIAKRSPLYVLRAMRQPLLIAFSTTSSEAAYPRTLEVLAKVGVRPKVASFVLPLGYAFNLDGAMVYAIFAVLFIAQAYGIVLTTGQITLMMMLLLVSSKGVAAVPRAVLVVVAATLPVFHIPAAGLGLLLGVDYLLDMGRSATNVLGNFVAACVVDRFEGPQV